MSDFQKNDLKFALPREMKLLFLLSFNSRRVCPTSFHNVQSINRNQIIAVFTLRVSKTRLERSQSNLTRLASSFQRDIERFAHVYATAPRPRTITAALQSPLSQPTSSDDARKCFEILKKQKSREKPALNVQTLDLGFAQKELCFS